MRSNSYNNKNGSRYTGGAGGAAEDERDQLLTPGEHRSGAGGSGSDLEIGNHAKSQRRSNKKDKHNRRNSNGLLGFSRRSDGRQMAGKERTLCLVATSLFVVLTVVLLIAARAIPNPFDRSPYLDPTDPNDPHQNPGKGGKGGPHVVVPIGGPQLPPPTDLPRNDAYLVKAEKGAVASEDVDCSKMGVDVLKEGGNAVVSIRSDFKMRFRRGSKSNSGCRRRHMHLYRCFELVLVRYRRRWIHDDPCSRGISVHRLGRRSIASMVRQPEPPLVTQRHHPFRPQGDRFPGNFACRVP